MKKLILILTILLLKLSSFAQTNCKIPEATEWKNLYPNCEHVQGAYKIQFFSTRQELMTKPSFTFHTKKTDCLTRYFWGQNDTLLTYCESLSVLEKVKKEFPDAFPKMIKKFNPIKKSENKDKRIQMNPLKKIFFKTLLVIESNSLKDFDDNFWNNIKKDDKLIITIPYYINKEQLYLNEQDNQTVMVTVLQSGKQWKGQSRNLWKYLKSFQKISEKAFVIED